ncbi:zinc finger protein 709-like [Ostrinia furnacalis]|uniref:zinc finger protein 709-like n=1 Tax=Ostrinia furnacalis TaxID=93504 RepID=UPI0010408F64|nr:zinc finger protein 709-like [Ostrinia furnacalis]
MEDILACRICLSTNIKLFNMFNYRLHIAYETLTGIGMSTTDGLPQYACSVCSKLLDKSVTFKRMCDSSQDLLNFAKWQETLSTSYIQSLKFTSPFSFSIKTNDTVSCDTNEETDQFIKEERDYDDDVNDDDYKVKSESSDDDLPIKILPKKIKISVERPRKIVKKSKPASKVKKKPVELKKKLTKKVEKKPKTENKVDLDDDIPKGEVDVIMLTKEQQIEEVQARKSTMNYLSSFYKCDLCFKGFISTETYKNHMERHDPSSGLYECDICHIRFEDMRALRGHLAKLHERNYVCKLCKHISKSKHGAKLHSKWHSGHTFVCKFCGMSFTKKTSHLSHVRIHHPSEHVNCDICGEAFIGEHGLRMHKQKAHRDVKDLEPELETKCANCKVRFQNIDAFKRHSSSAVDGQCDPSLRPCAKCGEGCISEFELKEHLKQHSKEKIKKKNRRMKCEECNVTFSLARSYTLHYQRVHLRLKDAFIPGRAPVVCEICGKKCTTATSLRFHQRTHTGERPYQCTECPKRFSVAQRLQIHQRTHSGERPYACPHCPKAFKGKPNLNRHVRVHTGAKPYSCSHCGKSFSQSNSMKVHIRTVHLKLPARSGLDSHELL